MNDIDRIEARIEAVRKELARLETAREVLAEIYGKERSPAARPAGKPSGNGHAKGFTLRRVADPGLATTGDAAPKAAAKRITPKVREKRKADKAMMREAVIATVRKDGPSSASDLFDRLKLKKDERQRLYQCLYDLKKSGVLKHGVDGIYALAPKPKAADQPQQPVH